MLELILLVVRGVQALFSIIVLGLTAYGKLALMCLTNQRNFSLIVKQSPTPLGT